MKKARGVKPVGPANPNDPEEGSGEGDISVGIETECLDTGNIVTGVIQVRYRNRDGGVMLATIRLSTDRLRILAKDIAETADDVETLTGVLQ